MLKNNFATKDVKFQTLNFCCFAVYGVYILVECHSMLLHSGSWSSVIVQNLNFKKHLVMVYSCFLHVSLHGSTNIGSTLRKVIIAYEVCLVNL